jgi:hypothetical protein
MADPGPFIEALWTAVGMGAVSAIIWWRVGSARRGQLGALARVPRKEVSRVRDGETVRIVGVVESAQPPLEAPLSGRPCLAWTVVAWLRGANQTNVTIDRAVDLIVRDSSGTAFAGAPQAALVLDETSTYGRLEQPPGQLGGLISADAWERRDSQLRFEEGVVKAGDEVALIGKARWQPDPEGGGGNYREPPKRLVLDGAVLTNLPKARR